MINVHSLMSFTKHPPNNQHYQKSSLAPFQALVIPCPTPTRAHAHREATILAFNAMS